MNYFPAFGKGLAPKLTFLYLCAVLVTGFALRTWNVNFDSGLLPNFDERSIVCIFAPAMGWPSSLEEFRDPLRSPLNPLRVGHAPHYDTFAYGHLPLYLGIAAGEVLSRLAPHAGTLGLPNSTIDLMRWANTPCQGVAFAGRLLIALTDTWTILLLYLLGRRVYGSAAGLLAATLYAFTAQAIQLSHFFALDPASTAFVVLTVYGGVLMVQGRLWRGALYAGGGAGLAVTVKTTVLPVLAVPFAAALIAHLTATAAKETPAGRRNLFKYVAAVIASFLLIFVVLSVVNPYIIVDWHKFVEKIVIEGSTARGINDAHFTRRFRDSVPYIHFIQQQVVWGMGWPLGSIACVGVVWAAAKAALSRAKSGELIAWTWLVPYFGLTGAYLAMFNRYMSPVLPFVLLFAAGLVVWLWQIGGKPRLKFHARILAALLALVAVGGGLFWSLAYVNGVYAREHTWIEAIHWLDDTAPADSVILWERQEGMLPLSVRGEPELDLRTRSIRQLRWDPMLEDTPLKLADLRQKLDEADFVILNSNQFYRTVEALPKRYPMTIRYYDKLFDEQLGFTHVADFVSMPRFMGLTFPDQKADIIWTSMDHPRVSIFAKAKGFDAGRIDAQLEGSLESAIPYDLGMRPRQVALFELLSPLTSFVKEFAGNASEASAGPEEDKEGEKSEGCATLQEGNALCFCEDSPAVTEEDLLHAIREVGRPKQFGGAVKDSVSLVGWELMADESVRPGDTFSVRLFWQTNGQANSNLHSFVHLFSESPPRSWAVAHDSDPLCLSEGAGRRGNIYVNELSLQVPLETPPTAFWLVTGVVSADGVRLAAPDSADGLVRLQMLSVEPIPTGFFQRNRFLVQKRPATTAQADTEDGLRLKGFDLLTTGDTLDLRFYWETTDLIANDWTVFVHLIDSHGERVAQFDGPPLDGLIPTSQWQKDSLYVDGRRLKLPGGLEPGPYLLRLGLYSLASGERMPFLTRRGIDEDRFEEGQLLIPLRVGEKTVGSSGN